MCSKFGNTQASRDLCGCISCRKESKDVEIRDNVNAMYPTPPKATKTTAIQVCGTETTFSKEEEAQIHLLGRLRGMTEAKREALLIQFGMKDDPAPQTRKELAQRFKDGKYVITPTGQAQDKMTEEIIKADKGPTVELYNDNNDYLLSKWGIRWRDPQKPEDTQGFKDAIKRRDDAYAKAMDIIKVKGSDEGLKALYDFEQQSFWS